MAKPKVRMKGVPAAVPTIAFRDVFESYVDGVAKVHGQQVAETYEMLRQGEAEAMFRTETDYPQAAEQLQDFLSIKLESE